MIFKPFTASSVFFVSFLLSMNIHLQGQESSRRDVRMQSLAEKRIQNLTEVYTTPEDFGSISIDSIKVQRSNKLITVFLNPISLHFPWRYHHIYQLEMSILNLMGRRFRNFEISLDIRGLQSKTFIPNHYRGDTLETDYSRIRQKPEVTPLVTRNPGSMPLQGLTGNHIALWHSHGLYFNAAANRWQWQRARLFETVEDIFPTQYIIQYIAPMLENSGAVVMLPRERDIQTRQVIIDNDHSTGHSEMQTQPGQVDWEQKPGGYLHIDTLFPGQNPFANGSHLAVKTNSGAAATFVPDIPDDGYYGVYISWAKNHENVSDVSCRINYSGGYAPIMLNQQMGHGTWVYLGTWWFRKGKNPQTGSLDVYTHSATQGMVTIDAVRFGGGMGNVARSSTMGSLPNQRSADDAGNVSSSENARGTGKTGNWKISGMPRWVEGSRYYLQFAGMPDTLVFSRNQEKNDYNDDFMSRGEWVNYLMGAPLGPQKERTHAGLGIPIDLTLAFHTDAGITKNDSTIGTLAIYSAQRDDGVFPDGISRLASRDLTDLIQTQIVSDIRALHNPRWTRRALWDRQYSEAWRPNTPAMLLELLSHQNLADMHFGLDPRFQFHVSRAIYKGILRFIASNENRDPVIQPLPPGVFSMEHLKGKRIRLSWAATPDPLEPTAQPTGYILYTRKENEGFDQGLATTDTFIEIELPLWDTIYSFRVTATNQGGESFPSETLSAAFAENQEKIVMIVNGFDRISGPARFDTGTLAGHTWWDDHAIPYISSLSYTGRQYDFRRNSPWLHDDSPGWGASHAGFEGKVLAGNTFDYPYTHGKAIRNAGYSFISTSRNAFENSTEPVPYFAINLIMGKQKGIPSWKENDSIQFRLFSPSLISRLERYSQNGGNILISGAYIATDNHIHQDTLALNFTKNTLGYSWRTNNATEKGDARLDLRQGNAFPAYLTFATSPNDLIYHVEAPDAIVPEGESATPVYLYQTNKTIAAVKYSGKQHRVFSLGFPFETIESEETRGLLMKSVLQFFEGQLP